MSSDAAKCAYCGTSLTAHSYDHGHSWHLVHADPVTCCRVRFEGHFDSLEDAKAFAAAHA